MDKKLTILIVDDDSVDRMAVRRALRSTRLLSTIEEATDHDSALMALTTSHVDVVLLDYRLPGTDGLQVLRTMRERGLMIPIIMLTGQGDEQLAIELLRAGATDYLDKSALSPDVLAQSILRAQRVYHAESLAAQAEQALHEAADRQRFLAEASQYLVESLDFQTTVERLVELSVRDLADACAVDILNSGGSLERVAVAALESPVAARLGDLLRTADAAADLHLGPLSVVRSGAAICYNALASSQHDLQPFLLPFVEAGATSIMIVPLAVRGNTTGAVLFVSANAEYGYSADDLHFAEDLAHRAAVALENARLYREAQEAIRVRDAFLSVAAHELKTPLTTLFGNAQLLQRRALRENSLSERDARSVRVMVEQTARLNRMISALLDLSRLQMGQFTIQTTPLDIVALTTRVIDELQPSLTNHSIELVGMVSEPIIVDGDELRLEQVLQNLLQNAIKYSPDGGKVTITVEPSTTTITIAVTDQGIGIPEAALPHLFHRFYRASNVQKHHISGIGVGLYVVSEIINLHGGTISVESIEGQGTTFTIRLPLQEHLTPLMQLSDQ